MTKAKNQYAPDHVVSTEQVLKGYIEDMGVSHLDLAKQCGYSPEYVSKIISGETRINEEIANRLEESLGLKAYIWLGIEKKHQDFLARRTQSRNNVFSRIRRIGATARQKLWHRGSALADARGNTTPFQTKECSRITDLRRS